MGTEFVLLRFAAVIMIAPRCQGSFVRIIAWLVSIAVASIAFLTLDAGVAHAVDCSSDPSIDGRTLEGTACSDVLIAPEGITSIEAGGGNDFIIGTPDVTTIDAGGGDDVVYGEYAPSLLDAQTGAALSGRQRIRVPRRQLRKLTPEQDIYFGSDGDQTLSGLGGNDFIWGGRGNDIISGGAGNDRLFGSVGDDYLTGAEDDDRLSGGNGSDNIFGNAGNDYVHGDTVGDIRDYASQPGDAGLHGGDGRDTLSFATAVTPGFEETRSPYSPPQGASWHSLIGSNGDFTGFPAQGQRGVYADLGRRMSSDGPTADNGKNLDGGGKDVIGEGEFEVVVGSAFSDVIIGDASANTIWGGGGADIILGLGGADVLYGSQDGDYLDGGNEDGLTDTLSGGGPAPSDSTHDHDQCVQGESTSGCENFATTPRKVEPPDPSKINVGLMSPGGDPTETGMSAYVTGSNVADYVTASFEPNTTNGSVLFTRVGGNAFNTATAAANGCTLPATGGVRCPLGPSGGTAFNIAPTVVVAGEAGADTLDTHLRGDGVTTANFPASTTKVVIGRDGNDTLIGDGTVQDVLIDGGGDDTLQGYDSSDSLYASDGSDSVHGNQGGDVITASRTCEDNQLDGGTEDDNVTWAPWNPAGSSSLPNWSQTDGVFATLATGKAGGRTDPNAPACPGSSYPNPVDELVDVENLEGSGARDKLIGDGQQNTLLGRAGVDQLFGGGDTDYLHAHSNDYDEIIDCGTGTGEKVALDFQRGDRRDIDVLQDCESGGNTVFKSYFPNGVPYIGKYPEYDRSVDTDVLNAELPLGLYRLGERAGPSAFEAFEVPETNGDWRYTGSYAGEAGGADAMATGGAIPDTDDRAHSLDGTNDYVELTTSGSGFTPSTPASYFDPFSYRSTGFTAELWAKFTRPPAGTYAGGSAEYLLSKTDGSNGVSLYRDLDGGGQPEVVIRSDRAGGSPLTLARTAPSDGGWHHYALVLADDATHGSGTMRLYVDGDPGQTLTSTTSSVFPTAANGVPARVGRGPSGTAFLPAMVDNLAIFNTALEECEVDRHAAIGTAGAHPGACP